MKKIISFLLASPAVLLAAPPPSLPPGAGVIEREIEQGI